MSQPPTPPSDSPAPVARNTVRVSGAELTKLFTELDANQSAASRRRQYIRWPFQKEAVRVEMLQQGSGSSVLYYACRNLSSMGVSLLHSAYIHPGTLCVVYLPLQDGTPQAIRGTVVRCRHYKGVIHEMGVKFTTAINIRDYVPVDPMRGAFTLEAVNPEALTGTLLHVDDSAMERRLMRHFLRDTRLNVVTVENATDALKRAGEGFDLMLIDFDLPDLSGPALVEKLRAADIQIPIILCTADSRPVTRENARKSRASGFLAKPITQDTLLRALAEFLLASSDGSDAGGALYSALSPEDPANHFLQEFVQETKTIGQQLQAAIGKDDATTVRRLSLQLRGSGASMGFPQLAAAAEATTKAIDASMSAKDSVKEIRILASLCQRLRARDGSAGSSPKAKAG